MLFVLSEQLIYCGKKKKKSNKNLYNFFLQESLSPHPTCTFILASQIPKFSMFHLPAGLYKNENKTKD